MSDEPPSKRRFIDRGHLRRGALFLAGIGIPLAIAVARHEPAGALIGPVCGLLFSFADETGRLRARFAILALSMGGILAGGLLGAALHGFAWPVWPLFALACFATGQFNRVGKAANMAARLSAMALVVTSGSPTLDLQILWYAILAFLVAAAARSIDQAVFGAMPPGGTIVRTPPPGGWTRFAVCYAAAALVSLWIGVSIDPERSLWVAVTTLMVMQSDARLSYVRIVQRTTGTVVGVVAAFVLTKLIAGAWPIAAAILLIAPLIPHHLQRRYWLHTALIAVLVLLAYDLAAADMHILRGLFTERLEDVALGAGIALIGTMIAFPRRTPDDAGIA